MILQRASDKFDTNKVLIIEHSLSPVEVFLARHPILPQKHAAFFGHFAPPKKGLTFFKKALTFFQRGVAKFSRGLDFFSEGLISAQKSSGENPEKGTLATGIYIEYGRTMTGISSARLAPSGCAGT